MNKINLTFILCILLQVPLLANGTDNNFFKDTQRSNVVNFAIENDPSIAMSLGYGYIFNLGKRNLLASLSVGVPIFLLTNFNHFSYTVDGSIFIFKDKWNIKTKLGFKVKSFNNELSKGSAFAGQFSISPGYFSKRWFISAELSYRKYFLSYLKHSNYYKKIYPDVKDGWYSNDSGYLFTGLIGGYQFLKSLEVTICLLYKATDNFQDYMPFILPFSATIGVGYSF